MSDEKTTDNLPDTTTIGADDLQNHAMEFDDEEVSEESLKKVKAFQVKKIGSRGERFIIASSIWADRIILSVFYSLLILTTLFALTNFFITFAKFGPIEWKNKSEKVTNAPITHNDQKENSNSNGTDHKQNQSSSENNKDNSSYSDDMAILKISEYIFLSLLPILIVFGFFYFYKNYARNVLLDLPIDPEHRLNATKTLSLIKILFLSSIISYVMIKIIEIILIEKDFRLDKTIASGVLLLVLMSYFFLLNHE